MKGPDSNNPNSFPPPRWYVDVIKLKRVTRSASMDEKLAPKYTFSISKPALGRGRKGSKKGVIKVRNLKQELEYMEFEDDVNDDLNIKDEDLEVRDDDSVGKKGFDGRGNGRD
ncbi:hypothetical protein Tco_1531520 [Tanacetum coccineum]